MVELPPEEGLLNSVKVTKKEKLILYNYTVIHTVIHTIIKLF